MFKKTAVFVYFEAPTKELVVLDQEGLFILRRKIWKSGDFRLRSRSANRSTETIGDNPNRSLVRWLELYVDSDVKSNRTYSSLSLMEWKSIQKFKLECFLLCMLCRHEAASVNLHVVSVLSNVFYCPVAKGENCCYKACHKSSYLQIILDRRSLLHI